MQYIVISTWISGQPYFTQDSGHVSQPTPVLPSLPVLPPSSRLPQPQPQSPPLPPRGGCREPQRSGDQPLFQLPPTSPYRPWQVQEVEGIESGRKLLGTGWVSISTAGTLKGLTPLLRWESDPTKRSSGITGLPAGTYGTGRCEVITVYGGYYSIWKDLLLRGKKWTDVLCTYVCTYIHVYMYVCVCMYVCVYAI